jgi:pimeloyl-ACP methyl ester carboxylesterase
MNMKLCNALAAMASVLCATANAGPVSDRIYPAPRDPLTSKALPDGVRIIEVATTDGLRLKGIATDGLVERPLLLVLHGNASSATGTMAWLSPLANAGFGIVAAEYRGYSDNPGRPSEAGLVQDARAFLAEARKLAGKRPVWVIGHSLGGAVALSLSRSERLDVLVTAGTFTRLREMVPALTRALVPNEYDNRLAVQTLDEPWYLIHGTRDGVVPWQQGQELHNIAGSAKRPGASFVILGGDHRPDAETLLTVLSTIELSRSKGGLSAKQLPSKVKLIPFGSSAPLNP